MAKTGLLIGGGVALAAAAYYFMGSGSVTAAPAPTTPTAPTGVDTTGTDTGSTDTGSDDGNYQGGNGNFGYPGNSGSGMSPEQFISRFPIYSGHVYYWSHHGGYNGWKRWHNWWQQRFHRSPPSRGRPMNAPIDQGPQNWGWGGNGLQAWPYGKGWSGPAYGQRRGGGQSGGYSPWWQRPVTQPGNYGDAPPPLEVLTGRAALPSWMNYYGNDYYGSGWYDEGVM